MKRIALFAAVAALASLGVTSTSQAQFGGFRIDLGNGVQLDTNRGLRVNTSRDYHNDQHDDHRVINPGYGHYDGDRHVVRYHDDRHTGHYYERGGQYYYDSGNGRAVVVRSGSFSHTDDLAIRLEQLTNELCLDMHYNYRHNPGFRETYREVYTLYELAKYIHDESHHGHHDEIARKLSGMDELFHHVQDDIRGWHRHHYRQIGSLGIIAKTERIEGTIHHLMNDVGARITVGLEEPPRPAGLEVAPRP